MRAIELFAGIGGLCLAAPEDVEVVAAYDQDHVAADVHAANHPGVELVRVNLESVTARELLRHEADAWLASPPCQPFTRRGAGRDLEDARCRGLARLIALMPECRPRRVLVENVPGFHGSRAHAELVAALRALGHDVADVEACPTELGAPVRRRRQFVVSSADGLADPAAAPRETRPLAAFLDASPDETLRLAVPAGRVADDGVAATFTRSYGRAITGAGPIARDARGDRYFSPEEILRLHAFPESFRFPDGLDLRTRWRLAGNSVHVGSVRRVASRLRCA